MDAFLELIRFSQWNEAALLWGGRVLTALAILLLGLWIARQLSRLVHRAVEIRGGDAVLANFLASTVRIGLTVIVVVAALERTGVPITSLLAALGAAGLAIGLALKDSLGNLASGVLLVIARPFRAGDFVDVGGQSGTVERIDLLRTVLVTPDNKVITVPNAQVMNQPIVNFSARAQRRLDLTLTLAHDADPALALRTIEATLSASARVLREPPPQLMVLRITQAGIELGLRPWVATTDLLAAQGELLAAVHAALQRERIALAQPLRLAHAPDPDSIR
jgi:small conductance mechanosensitive channel